MIILFKYEGENMKGQKIISVIAIAASLILIIYMCVVMFTDTGSSDPVKSTPTNAIIWTTPTPDDNSAAPSQSEQNTATSATPTPTNATQPTQPSVTSVPGGKTSTNPNYKDKKLIAITFDDGPHGVNTPKILDMLKEKNVKVTFFLIGENISSQSRKDIIKRAHDEGHELANHSYNHPNFKNISAEEIKEQLNKTDALIREAAGVTPILFRPPYGSYNQSISQQSEKAIVLWSIDSRDWEHISAANVKKYAEANGITEEAAKDILIDEILFKGTSKEKSIVSQLRHGSIILFHDIHPYSGEAVAKLIDYLKQSGEYELLTVSQLIETEQRSPAAGDVYCYMWETFATQKQNW